MRLLGVDYGLRRVGLATLDAEVGLAFPLRTIEGGVVGDVVKRVADVVREEGIELVVVGMPLALREEDVSGMKRVVEEFVGVLRGVVGCEVEVWNEQMTSAMVLKQGREMGLEKGQVDVDAAAAAVLLGDFWEYKKRAQG